MTKLKIIKRFIWFLIVITATIAFSVEIQNYTISNASAAETTTLDALPPAHKTDFKEKDNKPKAETTSSKEFLKNVKKTLGIEEKYRMTDIKTFTPDQQKVKICTIDVLIKDEEALKVFTEEKELPDNIEIITAILAEKDEDDFVGYGLRSIKEEIALTINAKYNQKIVTGATFEKLEIKPKELDKEKKSTPKEKEIDLEMQKLRDEKINAYLQDKMEKLIDNELAKSAAAIEKLKNPNKEKK